MAKRGKPAWNKGLKTGQVPWNKGKTLSEEYRKKLSMAKKGKNHPNYGKRLSEETRRKISIALRGKNNPMYGKSPSVEHRRKLSEAQTGENNGFYGKRHTDESKRKMRAARLKRVIPVRDTSIEVALQEELNRRNISYEAHVPVCGVCQPDIVFPELKTAVFADGEYWHRLPRMIIKDRRQEGVLKENGWSVLRFWGNAIREDVSRCVDEIEGVLG